MPSQPTKTLYIRVPGAMHDQLTAKADELGLSLTTLVQLLLVQLLRNGLTIEVKL